MICINTHAQVVHTIVPSLYYGGANCVSRRSDTNASLLCDIHFLQISQRRFNQALFARLRPRRTNTLASGAAASSLAAHNGESFCVGTYHMPCMFRIPPVMTIHTSMIVKHISRLAGTDPFVLAGDFNFVPDSACYKIVTEGGEGLILRLGGRNRGLGHRAIRQRPYMA